MSNIEQLQLLVKQASEELDAARTKVNEAKKALDVAKLEATGLRFHAAKRNSDGVKFLVEKNGWMDGIVKGRLFKKDDTLGVREIEARITGITDLGVYSEP